MGSCQSAKNSQVEEELSKKQKVFEARENRKKQSQERKNAQNKPPKVSLVLRRCFHHETCGNSIVVKDQPKNDQKVCNKCYAYYNIKCANDICTKQLCYHDAYVKEWIFCLDCTKHLNHHGAFVGKLKFCLNCKRY